MTANGIPTWDGIIFGLPLTLSLTERLPLFVLRFNFQVGFVMRHGAIA